MLRENGKTVVDREGVILAEYGKRLRPQGQPGVGDLFYRHILDNRGNRKSVLTVDLVGKRASRLGEAFARSLRPRGGET